jgi:hypothetical protein
MAEAISWQAKRLYFRSWAELPGALSRAQLGEVYLETYVSTIFMADDPDPEAG